MPENATIYDVEPEGAEKNENMKTLARRVRFYHSKIDAESFESGMEYQKLKNVIVIFIMPKDPLGANRMVYTIESKCKELPDLPYDDGAKTIFLYTKGIAGNPKQELKELLLYMEQSCDDNAKSDTLKKFHQMVKRIKSDEEVSLEYMKIFEREQMIKERGFKEGILVGREEGKQEGKQEGMREQAVVNAKNLLERGVDLEIVRLSIPLLSDEELKEIYQEVQKSL